jgi:hypothetical protein
MTILLNNVYVALEHIINTDQAFTWYTPRNNLSYKVKELFQLTQLKYIVEIK